MERHRDANSYEHADYQDEEREEESEEEVCGHGGQSRMMDVLSCTIW
jgi:hypothetical protein